MKILVIGDLHGRKPNIQFKDFDCIICVGDVCDDRKIAPLYKKYFKFINNNPDSKIGMDEFLIYKIGKRKLKKFEQESLEVGNKILKYLDTFEKPIFFVPGNWDQSYGKTRIKDMDKSDYNHMKSFYDFWLGNNINPILTRGIKNLKNIQYKNKIFKNINFIGYGLVSGPEKIKYKTSARRNSKNYSQKERILLDLMLNKIKNKLQKAYQKHNNNFLTIFITHNIPYDTKLDIVKNKDSYLYKKHLGSWVARKFCEKHQPLLCIGGHIHEGKGKDKIGKTIIINTGFGKNAQALIDIDEDKRKIKSIKFIKS